MSKILRISGLLLFLALIAAACTTANAASDEFKKPAARNPLAHRI